MGAVKQHIANEQERASNEMCEMIRVWNSHKIDKLKYAYILKDVFDFTVQKLLIRAVQNNMQIDTDGGIYIIEIEGYTIEIEPDSLEIQVIESGGGGGSFL